MDAGKTTLSEALLFVSGSIRSAGRVDHGDAFLDTDAMEKERGITIFSKQARLEIGGSPFTLLDTPGHGDLSPEMERTLRVMDACILVISAADGIGGHVRILWELLAHYRVPVFLFINKMDQPGADRDALLEQVRRELSEHALDMGKDPADPGMQEEIALCDDSLTERYLEGGHIAAEDIAELVSARKLFPVLFGSALRMEGIRELAEALVRYVRPSVYCRTGTGEHTSAGAGAGEHASAGAGEDTAPGFGARVFKITHENGTRLTWMRITGGSLKARDPVGNDKVSQIRLYSGERYTAVQEAAAGEVCAVAGLTFTFAGQGLGTEPDADRYIMQPVQMSAVQILDGTDTTTALGYLKELEEEEPLLHVAYDEQAAEIRIRIMGQIQAQILQRLIGERFGMAVEFGPGTIVYRETITAAAEGVGHYEPLRHYSEVHLLLEPGLPGSGLILEDRCTPDTLEGNYRRLIMKHLAEKTHKGVLTGAPVTDMRISLTAGAASPVHTEGGDFRQSTYRAVRQGLMMAASAGNCVLLEPVMDIRLDIPRESLGRTLSDLQQMHAELAPPEVTGERASLTGTIPASEIGDYPQTLASFTRGEGSMFTAFREYAPCHNAEEVIAAAGYVPEEDLEEPASSIFCRHGAALLVQWNEVRDYMHIDTGWKPDTNGSGAGGTGSAGPDAGGSSGSGRGGSGKSRDPYAAEKELMAIFERTYGPIKRNDLRPAQEHRAGGSGHDNGRTIDDWKPSKNRTPEKSYLLVDGYNIIFAWEDLRDLALDDIGAARDKLLDILSNYAGYCSDEIIVVFDAYRVTGGLGEVYRYHNIDVVFTREAETADLYIEKTSHELAVKKHYRVTVATSDAIEQVIIFGTGALRLSARGLLEQILAAQQEMRERYLQ